MRMICEIVGEDLWYRDVVRVRVPGIYGPRKGLPLPRRMARLVRPAALALKKVYQDIVAEGGRLYLTDMFRSAADQQRAHADYLTGRKSSYSPPACSSVHEAARAVDIDTADTIIGHRRVREILNNHGWINIVDSLTGPECWHYEFREKRWEQYRREHGYRAMAHATKKAIGNTAGLRRSKQEEETCRGVQAELNRILPARLVVDGIYGEKTRTAMREFQQQFGLLVDGIAGPITRQKIEKLLIRRHR